MVVDLIQEADKPVDFVSCLFAQPADRSEDILRRSVVLNVQPIEACNGGKEERRLSELAGSGKTLEQIAKAMDRTPDAIRNRSIRLVVSIKSKAPARKIRG